MILSVVSVSAALPNVRGRVLLPQVPVESLRSSLLVGIASRISTYWGHVSHPLDALKVSREFLRPKAPVEDGLPFDKSLIQEVHFPTSDGRVLHGYYIPAEEKTNNVTMFCHGRSGDVEYWCPSMLAFQDGLRVNDAHTNILLFDYRGYGKSEGNRPTRLTAPKDAYAAWCFLRAANFKPENIHVVGHSTGAAIALRTTQMLETWRRESPASLTLVSPYRSPREATVCTKPGIAPWKVWLVGTKILNPERMISEINPDIPVNFLHGRRDEYFPSGQSQALFDVASSRNKQMILCDDGSHCEIFHELNGNDFSKLSTSFNQQS